MRWRGVNLLTFEYKASLEIRKEREAMKNVILDFATGIQ
jgi:hypothetical protein